MPRQTLAQMEMESDTEIRVREGLSFLGCEAEGSSCRVDGTASRGVTLQNTTDSRRHSPLPPSDYQSSVLSIPHAFRHTNTKAVGAELAKIEAVRCNLTFQEGTELN